MGDQAIQAMFEQALCHAALLIERITFYSRNLGLAPEQQTDSDMGEIFAGFRRIAGTQPEERAELLPDPLAQALARSRAELMRRMAEPACAGVGFVRMMRELELGEEALEPLLLALAPDWDARIARLFSYLSEDPARGRPTLGQLEMVMQGGLPTLAAGPARVLEERLLAPGILCARGAAAEPRPRHEVLAPAHVVELSRTVAPAPHVASWQHLLWPAAETAALRRALGSELGAAPRGRLILLEGLLGSGRASAAAAAIAEAGRSLESCPLASGRAASELEAQVTRGLLRARVLGGVLVVRSDGALRACEGLWRRLSEGAARLGVAVVALVQRGEIDACEAPVRFRRVTMPELDTGGRRALWQRRLDERGLGAHDALLDDVAGRYELPPGRIGELADELSLAHGTGSALELGDVRAALREITAQRLEDLATREDADVDLDDLVLPPETRVRLDELVGRVGQRHRVLDRWNFGKRSRSGWGVSALFTGAPGTGKTAAACAVARALEVDLYVVDLSKVMSKWVGETEQNLGRIFDEAEASSVALLFDEADSLFGKRSSDTKSASDKYANLTVNYLLQRMETYRGLVILTTNLESAIDQAFSRRLSSRVNFPEPDEDYRLALWQRLLPRGVRFAHDVDLEELVERHALTGARIRNALVRAAFLVAGAGGREPVLHHEDLMRAASFEYEDMGRLPTFKYGPITVC